MNTTFDCIVIGSVAELTAGWAWSSVRRVSRAAGRSRSPLWCFAAYRLRSDTGRSREAGGMAGGRVDWKVPALLGALMHDAGQEDHGQAPVPHVHRRSPAMSRRALALVAVLVAAATAPATAMGAD